MPDKRKTTTKRQFEVLIAMIEGNEGVAGDRIKGSCKFWQEVTVKLNELGPPIKDISGWKKVWADYKSALKKKLSFNNAEYRSTGGGPCSLRNFNALEQKVIEVLDMQRSVVGTPDVPPMGLAESEDSIENECLNISPEVTELVTSGACNRDSGHQPTSAQIIDQEVEIEEVPVTTEPARNSRRKRRTLAEQNLLELRKFNVIQQKILNVKIEKQETNKARLETEKEHAKRKFELKQKAMEMQHELAIQDFQLRKEIAEKELELKYAKLEQISNANQPRH